MHRAQALYAAAQGEAALISRYGNLIDRIARRISMRVGTPSLADDLWSAGALGLLDAAKRFDAGRDVKFESFAEHRIRGAMLDEIRRMDHLPRRLRARTDQVSKAKEKLAKQLGRESTTEELAVALGMELEELAEIELLKQPHLPLTPEIDTPSKEDSLEEVVHRQQLVARMTAAISSLPERLQTLLALHYVEEFTYREIGKLLEISEARVCQLHAEAIGKIRNEIRPAPKSAEEPMSQTS